MSANNVDHDAFDQTLRASAADVLRRCDSDVAPGVVRAIRERSLDDAQDRSGDGAPRVWFGWREAVGVAAVLTLAAGVWWSGFESGRIASELDVARGQAVMQTLPRVGDRTGSTVRGVLASAEGTYNAQARALGAAGEQVARRVVDGMVVPGLWNMLGGARGNSAGGE